MRAELVRVIGGPTGSGIGMHGSTGPIGRSLTGATGLLGATGLHGLTGHAGLAGIFTALLGMTGAPGPGGADGYPGPIGPQGRSNLVIDDSYFFYGQNLDGFTGFPATAANVGCKFRYTIKGGDNGGFLFIFFTGQFIDTANAPIDIGITYGWGPAPNAGDWGGYPSYFNGATSFRLSGTPYKKVPFFIAAIQSLLSPDNYIPGTLDRWFDLAGLSNPAGGSIKNVTAVIFEVSL